MHQHVTRRVFLPALAVIILFYAVGHWNAYFNALIYIRGRHLYLLRECALIGAIKELKKSPAVSAPARLPALC